MWAVARTRYVQLMFSPLLGNGQDLNLGLQSNTESNAPAKGSAPPSNISAEEGEKMNDLIEIELTRVRRMAEGSNDVFLLYLIDMAIIEARLRLGPRDNSQVMRNAGADGHDDHRSADGNLSETQTLH
jgi:hypothetical protein